MTGYGYQTLAQGLDQPVQHPKSCEGNLRAFVFGLGAAVLVCVPAMGLEAVSPKVIAVDPDTLVRHVLPRASQTPELPSLHDGRISRRYLEVAGGQAVDLQLAIHPDAEGAGKALLRTMPQQPGKDLKAGEIEGFLSWRSCHLRYRNLLVLLQLDSSESTREKLSVLCGLLRDGLTDPAAVHLGPVVDTPQLRIETLRGPESGGSEEGVRVTFSVEGGGEILIESFRGARQPVGGSYEVLVAKESGEREPMLRVARPSGEIAEVTLSGMLKRGLKVLPPPGPPPLLPAARDAMVTELRSGRLSLQAQARLMLRLAENPTIELVPIFEETLASGADPVVKQHAFQGLVRALGNAGIERYRRYAADRRQAEVVRLDAIRMIGRYGEPRDRALLDAIAAEDNENFTEWIQYAIAGLKARSEPQKK